jgi:hypothetical protein
MPTDPRIPSDGELAAIRERDGGFGGVPGYVPPADAIDTGTIRGYDRRALLGHIAALTAENARLRALLGYSVTLQTVPCRHEGIGAPGCVTCDPNLRAALARLTPEVPHE